MWMFRKSLRNEAYARPLNLVEFVLHRRVIGAAARRQRKSGRYLPHGKRGNSLVPRRSVGRVGRVAYLSHMVLLRASRRSLAAMKSRGRSSRKAE